MARGFAASIVAITEKSALSPRGDARDYVSLSIYWWPNPITCLPYLPRDGVRNPEAGKYDAPKLRQMTGTIRSLAAANLPQANARALEWLRVWFMNPATRMNPHLTFAQMMPGWVAGGRQGVIEGLPLATELLDAIAWMDQRGVFTSVERESLREWFAEYLAWLVSSPSGVAESARSNNHGTWYDVQVTALATALGLRGLARSTLERAHSRLKGQFMEDGSQPEEIRRTKVFAYSLYNLEAWMHLERLASSHDISFWRLGPESGLRYLEKGVKAWTHQDLEKPQATALVAFVRRLEHWKIVR